MESRYLFNKERDYPALPCSHFNWNRCLAYGVRFDEVQLPVGGAPVFVPGERYYAHPNNCLYPAPVLKLHGSLNWMRFSRPDVRLPCSPSLPGGERNGVRLQTAWWEEPESYIRGGWEMEPVLVPPVLLKEKFLQVPILRDIWSKAEETLSRCERLIVIGYSFPPTDIHVRSLLRFSFAQRRLGELIVVNPDPAAVMMAESLTNSRGRASMYRDVPGFIDQCVTDYKALPV